MKKKKITYKHIMAILFSVLIFGYLFTIGERLFRSAVLGEPLVDTVFTDYETPNDAATDWSTIYPIEEEETEPAEETTETEEKSETHKSIKDTVEGIVKYYQTGVNYFTNQLLYLRMDFVELNAKFNKIIGNKLISGSDEVIVMADGNLTYKSYSHDMTKSAENLTEFSEFVSENGGSLLYVQAPSKVDPDNNYLPGGMTDYDNIAADDLLSSLKENGVNTLDLRDSMKQQGMNFTDSFYKTDHHWKTSTGLWATNQIARSLSPCGIPYNEKLLDINNYNQKTYKNIMLGSLGKKVSLAYADPEDFTLITPKFETDFSVNYYNSVTREGSFTDAFIDMSVFNEIDYYNISVYSSYMYGNAPIVNIENKKADNDKRILFIGDSFDHTVVPFLATQVRYVDVIDLRYFDGGVKSLIKQTNPDAVVVMYYPTTLIGSSETSTLRFR